MLTKRRRALIATAANSGPHGKCGPNAYWFIKDGVLTIRGTGKMWDDLPRHYSPNDGFWPPWYKYKDEITEVYVSEGITIISNHAFYKLSNVEKVTIPQSVTFIRAYAFNSCSSLEDIYLHMKTGEIYYWAFENCNAVKRVHIDSLTDYCKLKLDQLYFPGGTDLLVNGVRVVDLVIPNDVTTTNAFGGYSIETVFIPKDIEVYAHGFEKCLSLRTVTFENGTTITKIPAYAFFKCSQLVSVNIPDTVEIIEGSAFAYCPLLQMSRLPLAIKAIQSNQYGAFQHSGLQCRRSLCRILIGRQHLRDFRIRQCIKNAIAH